MDDPFNQQKDFFMPTLPPNTAVSNDSKLVMDLLALYDAFVEIQDTYAFLGDAITSLLQTHSELEYATLEGMRAFANEAKHSAGELKDRFKNVLEQCRAKEYSSQ